MSNDFDNLLDRINRKPDETEEIPEPGSDENPWIGINRIVNGQKQFYALSGAERRQARRAGQRAEEAEQRKGQRRYNRQQRKQEFDAGTVRQQARILTGEIPVTDAMRNNLHGHILRQTRLNQRADTAEDRALAASNRRHDRLHDRRIARITAGSGRHADLVALGLREA